MPVQLTEMLLVSQFSMTQHSGLSVQKKVLLVCLSLFLPFCLHVPQSLFKNFSVVLLSILYKCIGCLMHLYIMYFEKKNTTLLFFFYSPEEMPRFHGWFKIDARHILSDPIKLFHSHCNFSGLTHIPTVVLMYRNMKYGDKVLRPFQN